MAKEVINTQGGTCMGCQNCGMGCNCGGMHGYHGHPLLRIVLALVLLGFVFAAGMKLGELKAELGLGYEQHYMGGHHSFDMYGQDSGWAMPMMGTTIVAPTTSAPSAPAATTSSKK